MLVLFNSVSAASDEIYLPTNFYYQLYVIAMEEILVSFVFMVLGGKGFYGVATNLLLTLHIH
jgi:hypothetical protein